MAQAYINYISMNARSCLSNICLTDAAFANIAVQSHTLGIYLKGDPVKLTICCVRWEQTHHFIICSLCCGLILIWEAQSCADSMPSVYTRGCLIFACSHLSRSHEKHSLESLFLPVTFVNWFGLVLRKRHSSVPFLFPL